MKRTLRSILMISLLVPALAACNMPGSVAAPTVTFPTPNQTMTALFSGGESTKVILPVATNTPPPTNTPEVAAPTNTTAPTETASVSPTTAASATPAATATAVKPTNIPVDTSKRTGASAVAKYFSTAPTIDGDWGEWDHTQYPANAIVYGASNWKNDADLRPSFQVGWDNTYLYVGVKVYDDVYAATGSGANIYKGDDVEIQIDTNVSGDYFTASVNNDDFQLGVMPGKETAGSGTEAYLWLPNGKAGSRTDIKIGARRDNTELITRYEIAIPWTVFGITPANGMHLGFALSVSDNDNTGTAQQQTMMSSISTRTLLDPTTWGDLTLSK